MSKQIIPVSNFKDFPWDNLEPYNAKIIKYSGKQVININGVLWELPENFVKLLESYFERGEKSRSEKIRSLLSN